MTIKRSLLLALVTGLSVSACATSQPTCRDANTYERAAFGAVVAHDEARLASMMAPGPARNRVQAMDPRIQGQIFGQRMGDASVRTIVMQPPLCVVDQTVTRDTRMSYIYPNGRFERLQASEVGLGVAGRDYAACQFTNVDGQWLLSDACTSTFAPPAPAS